MVPRTTSPEKIEQIEFYGGRCDFVDKASEVYDAAAAVAADCGGHYLDQFTYAERATDWRGNNNIAESLFAQMRLEPQPEPRYIVCAAGTGGTSATLARYVRYRRHATEVVVADPEDSVFFDYYASGDRTLDHPRGSRIEGIGRPRVEASFMRDAIDAMVKVPDAASVAAMHWLSARSAAASADRPAPSSTARCRCSSACTKAARPRRPSSSCATAASATRTATTTRTGSRRRASIRTRPRAVRASPSAARRRTGRSDEPCRRTTMRMP